MQDFIDKKIVLGICGGIAAYKTTHLIRDLIKLGANVQVVMTDSAAQFVSPLTLQALSGNAVRMTLFDNQAEQAMGHIELARWADYFVIVPASANCLAKFAQGIADDLLSTLYLVVQCPVIISPAMNKNMWAHPATQQNCLLLKQRGVLIVGPDVGVQACGDYGLGRLSEVDTIISALRLHNISGRLTGLEVLITAGPTQEALDPVRFISNRSSGKMGYALAEAAKTAGADVVLISGPTLLTPPTGITVQSVISAQEMHQAVMNALKPGMIVIACAAVADFRVVTISEQKIKKQVNQEDISLHLTPNPDILARVASSGKARYVVGFAAETETVLYHASQKRIAKNIDMIIANEVGVDRGFDCDSNQVTVLTKHPNITIPRMHKVRLAGEIIAIIATILQHSTPMTNVSS